MLLDVGVLLAAQNVGDARARETSTSDSRDSEYLQKEGFNCDNRLSSDKPRHVYCRTFESAEHWFDVFTASTSALVAHADLRYGFEG
jgi:hypothetical protein